MASKHFSWVERRKIDNFVEIKDIREEPGEEFFRALPAAN